MVKIVNNEGYNLVTHLTDLQKQYQYEDNCGLKALIETLNKALEKSKINKDESINLHVYSLYELYHYTVNLEPKENKRRERMLEILNSKLDVLLKGVPKFFKDAFENRELYLYSNKNMDLFSFLKNNTLLPLFHKDNGTIRGCDELEKIIPSIRDSISGEIERINGFITNPPQLDYTAQEKQKLPFFELLKSIISPEIAQKYNYEFLTSAISSKLKVEQSRFRAVQLERNEDLGDNDHRLGIDWNGNDHTDRTSKNFFSHVHPACLSEEEDYNSSNIKIKDENGVTKTLDHFLQGYLEVIKERHRIEEITMRDNYTPEFHSHIFLAEDHQNTNPSPEQKEHARLKLECKAPKHVFNYTQNFFIRMAFKATEEPYVYKMTKEGRDEYHHNMIFYKSSFRDSDYIYAADDTTQVTEITESTYQQAASSVCGRIIKQADQKSYLTMAMHLVPINSSQGIYTGETINPQLISRGSADIDDEDGVECDGQSSHSRIDITSNSEAQNLSKGRLEASSFKIQSINFDRVSALVANKKLYQVSTNDTQPVEACIQAMQEKMNRITGKENNLSSSPRPSAPPQSQCSTRPASPLIGAACPSQHTFFLIQIKT